MSAINVKTAELKKESENLETLSSGLQELVEKGKTLQTDLPATDSMDIVKTQLQAELDKVEQEGQKLLDLSKLLNDISDYYETAENQVMGAEAENQELETDDGNQRETKAEEEPVVIPETVDSRTEKSKWDTAKELAEIFGMSVWESLSLMVDLVQALGTGAVEAIILMLKGDLFHGDAWAQWAYQYMPNHVDDKTLLAVYTLMSIVPVDAKTRAEHLTYNESGMETYQNNHPNDTYIEDQNAMKGIIKYGNHDASYNACEVIAVYNALMALNGGESPVSFPELLNHFEGAGIAAGGEFGTDPSALNIYLEATGYDTKMISGGQISSQALGDMEKQYDTYILTTYNDKNDVSAMIHTISVTKEGNQYVLHNAGNSTPYDSLEKAINAYENGNSEPISVIGVK